jgi:hypothetical protein
VKEANLLNSELIVCPIKVSDARTTIAKSPSKKAYSVNEAPSVLAPNDLMKRIKRTTAEISDAPERCTKGPGAQGL